MIIIPNRRIWTRQPQHAERLGKHRDGVFISAPALCDLVRGNPANRTAGANSDLIVSPSTYGMAVTNTVSAQAYYVELPDNIGTSALTLVFLAEGKDTASIFACSYCGWYDTGSNTGLTVHGRHPALGSSWGVFNGTSFISAGETWPVTGLHSIVFTRSADGYALYRNGILLASSASSALGAVYTKRFALGGDSDYYNSGSPVPVYYGGIFLNELWGAYDARALYENPWQIYKRRSRHVFVGTSGGGADVTTSGSIGGISLSATTGSATGSAATSGSIGSISLSAATGSATASFSAAADIKAVSLSAVTGSATGSATATGAIDTVSLTAATGTASAAGDVTTDGAIAALSLSAATGAATGAAAASGALAAVSIGAVTGAATTTSDVAAAGSISAVSLTAATGAASTAGDVVASASMSALSLSAPTGSATGAATTSAAIAAVSLSAATGTASAGSDISASGSIAGIGLTATTGTATPSIQAQAAIAALSLSVPTGSATGTAATSAALATISLSAATGTASAGADVAASGSIAVIGLTAPLGTATISIEAQAVIAAVFMSVPTGVATGSATCSGAMSAISLSACRGAASNGLEDLPYLSQMVFARTFEQREFARISDGRYFVRRS